MHTGKETRFSTYMRSVLRSMVGESKTMRDEFKQATTSGENLEKMVNDFLKEHLPKRFTIDKGFAISCDEEESAQADLLVVDSLNNVPFYPQSEHKKWPVEAVYAMIEVKANLDKREINDAVEKCRKFKALRREFVHKPSIPEPLFVLWGFESLSIHTVKKHLVDALSSLPRDEHPDFIVVPNKLVATSGSYLHLTRLGQPNSPFRQELKKKHGDDLSKIATEIVNMLDYRENSLSVWYAFFRSWLANSSDRASDILAYVPTDMNLGEKISSTS